MKEINGEEIFGIEDVRYSEEAWCEHCMDLEPYDATVEMGTNWCIDCANCSDEFQLSDNEREAIKLQEMAYKFVYFNDKLKSIMSVMGEEFAKASEETVKLLHPVKLDGEE